MKITYLLIIIVQSLLNGQQQVVTEQFDTEKACNQASAFLSGRNWGSNQAPFVKGIASQCFAITN